MYQHIIDYLRDKRERCDRFQHEMARQCSIEIVLLMWERPWEPTPLEAFEF